LLRVCAEERPEASRPPPEGAFAQARNSSEFGTNKTVKATSWPWLEPYFRQKSLQHFWLFPSCSAAEPKETQDLISGKSRTPGSCRAKSEGVGCATCDARRGLCSAQTCNKSIAHWYKFQTPWCKFTMLWYKKVVQTCDTRVKALHQRPSGPLLSANSQQVDRTLAQI